MNEFLVGDQSTEKAFRPVRVVYIASGNPLSPSSGLDIVTREHIVELTGSGRLETSGLFVMPVSARHVGPLQKWPDLQGFRADDQIGGDRISTIRRKLLHLISGKLMMNYGLVCPSARAQIKAMLHGPHDVVVIDHLLTLANVSMWRLLTSRARLVLISHDVTPLWLMDLARLRSSRIGRLLLTLESAQAWAIEVLMLMRADHIVFLSDWDLRYYSWLVKKKASSLCPELATPPATDRSAGQQTVTNPQSAEIMFVGSPSFAPNRYAIEWLVNRLAPCLLDKAPHLSISLVGRGTETFLQDAPPNVRALGFVSDDQLARLLADCLCSVCPIAHGGGLKIKLLEAFSAGCPVIATEEALRGFAFMETQPALQLDKPEVVACLIAELASDRALLARTRDCVRSAWSKHVADRDQALCRVIESVLA